MWQNNDPIYFLLSLMKKFYVGLQKLCMEAYFFHIKKYALVKLNYEILSYNCGYKVKIMTIENCNFNLNYDIIKS